MTKTGVLAKVSGAGTWDRRRRSGPVKSVKKGCEPGGGSLAGFPSRFHSGVIRWTVLRPCNNLGIRFSSGKSLPQFAADEADKEGVALRSRGL